MAQDLYSRLAHIVLAVGELSGDQIAIMNLIAKSGKDALTVREIEQSRFGATPWFKRWLQVKQPKKDVLVTVEDIRKSDVKLESKENRNIIDEMLKVAETAVIDWNAEQSIFEKNKCYLLVIDQADMQRLFQPYGPQAVSYMERYTEMARQSDHPTLDGKIVLAWVRYTEMDDGSLWIHEVQTDMLWAVGTRHITQRDFQDAMRRGGPRSKEANYYIRELIQQRKDSDDAQLSLFEYEVFKEFVAEFHDSVTRIIFPTPDYRLQHYPADLFGDKAAPVSVYNEMPKRMRFSKRNVKDLNVPAPDNLKDGEVWVFASRSRK